MVPTEGRKNILHNVTGKLDDKLQNVLPTGYSSMPQFMAIDNEEGLKDIRKGLHLCFDNIFDRYGAV